MRNRQGLLTRQLSSDTHRFTDRHRHRQTATDTQNEKQTDTQTDRQTHTHQTSLGHSWLLLEVESTVSDWGKMEMMPDDFLQQRRR